MTKMNRHFSTTHLTRHRNQPPLPPPLPPHHHHHYLPHRPQLHHPLPHHHQAQAQARPDYPSNETNLIQEVLYLHSLWHRGPPSHTPSGPTNPYLKPTHTTHFKKHQHVSDKEWPVPEVSQELNSGSGWAPFRVMNKPITRPATEEEKVRVLGVRVQMRGVEASSCLFRKRNEDGEEEEEEEEEDDGEDEEEIDFFENLFEEDKELKEFYVRNCGGEGSGEFFCLVCGVGRKYKNCVALVQHSITVSKTKRRKAHRAYGNVVCKVLGWDVNRLPSLPLDVAVGVGGGGEDELGGSQSVGKPSEGEINNDADGVSAGAEMERNAAIAESSQTEMETIPDAAETENFTSTSVGCSAIELTPVLGEVKNDADGGPGGVEMETNAALAEPTQTDMETIPEAPEMENVTSTAVGCTAAELNPALGDVKSHRHEESTVVEMERDASPAKSDKTGTETIPDSLEKEIVTSSDAGCIAKEQPNGSEEVVNKNEEGCPVLESKPVECESALVEDDPFEQLPTLPGAFQIPE